MFKKNKRSLEGIIRHRERVRKRAKEKYHEFVSAELCYRCSKECGINLATGKPFHACRKHRSIEAARYIRMREKKKAGLAKLANA